MIGPFVAGGIAAAAGGREGWRWAFIFISLGPVLLGLALMTQRDPQRGRFEQEAVLGEATETVDPPVRVRRL